jgi:biotin operon repressor
MLGVPAPSVRRVIGALRQEGWLITTVGGFYCLEDAELS